MTLKQHYSSLYKEFGDSHKAVQYSSKESQYRRFEVLCDDIINTEKIIDLGCGLGDMLSYLRIEKGFTGEYLGLDFMPEFIHQCNTKFQNDALAAFKVFDVLEDPLPADYDSILLSGVFNNLMADNWGFITHTISKMHQASKRMSAFNALSTYVDYQDAGLYYTNPLEVLDFCKKTVSPFITIKHDYLVKKNSIPFEFTTYLYK